VSKDGLDANLSVINFPRTISTLSYIADYISLKNVLQVSGHGLTVKKNFFKLTTQTQSKL
jgi:hypothetical protein